MEKSALEQLTTLVFFLYFLEKDKPNVMYGAHTVSEAFEAVCFMLGKPVHEVRKACSALDVH